VADPGRVLVIDDDPAAAKLLAAVLGEEGHVIDSAGTAATGLTRVVRGAPDLVLLDLQLPDLNGVEVCRRIRTNPTTAMLPVLMMTASGTSERLSALDAGADDFVTKPFDRAELIARVRSLLRIKRAMDTIGIQAAELAQWNVTLEARVDEHAHDLERLQQLRSFLSPVVVDRILSATDDTPAHELRREIAEMLLTDGSVAGA
jgi:adenylate cyclase